MYSSVVGALLEMNRNDKGIQQAALIGAFTLKRIIVLGFVKLFKDYCRPQV
jgi:hypothetical protein